MKKQRLFAALPLLLAGLCTAAPAADNITTPEQLFPQLDGILKQAIAQSPAMINRAIDLEIAEQDRIASRAGMLPSFGGNASVYQARDDRADLDKVINVSKVYYNFSVNQAVYHWGDKQNSARMGEIRQSLTQGLYREAYRKLAQEVRAQYFRLIIGKVRKDRAAFYADFTAKQRKQAEVRVSNKALSDAQFFTIRMEAERAQIAAERTAFDFENEKASFARLTGMPPLRDDEIPTTIPAVASQEEAIQQVLAGFLAQKDPVNAEAEAYRKSVKLEEINLAMAKVRLMPKFSAVVGASQDEQSYTYNTSQKYAVQSIFAGVSMNWSIFDGFNSGAVVRTSLGKLRQMRNDYRMLTERLAAQAQSQARITGFSARYAAISDRYLESSEGNVRSKKAEFARGVISEEDMNGSQLNLYDSQLTALVSRADYYNQVCEFLGTVMADPVIRNLAQK